MNSDNREYNQSPRVRRIPITVESRDGPRSGVSGNMNDTHNNSNSHSNHHNQSNYNNQNSNHRQSNRNSPYTSTVKIETKPEIRNTRPAAKQESNQGSQNRPTEYHAQDQPAPMEVDGSHKSSSAGQPNNPVRGDCGSKEQGLKDDVNHQHERSQASDDLDIQEADPKTPIPMPPPPSHEGECSAEDDIPKPTDVERDRIASKIDSVKKQAIDLVRIIEKFEYTSSDTKEFRYIEEMLTRCVLELDQLECSQLPELRQQRKELVRCVDQASKVLHKKVELNATLSELFTKMKS